MTTVQHLTFNELSERLRGYERKYGYSTIEFYRRFQDGELGDDDDLHASAVAVNNELARLKAHILTTGAVLVEVANSFSKVPFRPLAQRSRCLQQSTRMGAATLVHVDERLWRGGWLPGVPTGR